MFSYRLVEVLTANPIPTEVRNADLAIARHREFGRLWLDAMWDGDPLADAVAADLAGDLGYGPGMRMLRTAISDGIDAVPDAPDSLLALFAELDREPEWLDHDACDRACGHLVRQSSEFGLVLAAASLLAGASNQVAGRPLHFTGRYGSKAAVRSIEVGSWLLAATTPGGLRRGGPGFEQTVRVRMIHALVRSRLDRNPEWDAAAWGRPIPQPFMAFTLAEFGSVALRAMHRLGVRYSGAELADIYALWRAVGNLVGVDGAINPVTAADQHRIEDLYALTSAGPDDEDRAFVASLSEFQADEFARLLPGPVARFTPAITSGFQRAFIGDAAADALAIPDTPLKHLPEVISPVASAAYGVFDRFVPRGKERRAARRYRVRELRFEELRDAYGVRHQLVDDAPAP